jgi:hypothetical protein
LEGETVAGCVNLKELHGKRYRITWDPSREGLERDPWLMQIPCQQGTIYPYGGDLLAAEVDHHPKTAKKLASIPGVRLTQDGDHEKTFVFPVALFEQVAALLGARKRKVLTDEQRQALVEAGQGSRFTPGAQSEGCEHQGVPGPSDDPEAA